jgi:hypothetical protein
MATVTEEIDLPVNTNADEAAGEFKNLRTQIRETTVALQALEAQGQTNTAEFEALRKKLDELNDTADVAAFRAGQLDDRLAALPGVAGQAGQAFKSFNDTLKILATNPVLLTITLIVGALVAMKKSLESTAEGQATLNRISTAFSKILGPILATIEAVALPLFEGLAFVLEKVGQGFAFVAEKIGISKTKIAEASSGNKDFAKSAEDARKAAEAAAEKLEAEAKARREKYAAELKKSEEIIFQARLALMSQRDAELEQAAKKHEDNLIQLRITGGKGIVTETERYLKERKAINDKYNKIEQEFVLKTYDEQIKRADEFTERDLKRQLKTAELEGTLNLETEKQIQTSLQELKLDQFNAAEQAIKDNFAKERATQRLNAQDKIAFDQQTNDLLLYVNENYEGRKTTFLDEQENERLELTKKYADKQKEFEQFRNIEVLQGQIEYLDELSAQKDFDFESDITRERSKLTLQEEIYNEQIKLLKDNTAEKIKLDNEYAKNKQASEKRITEIEKSEKEYRYQIASKYAELAGQIGRLLSQSAGDNKDLALAGLAIESASAAAIIGINAYKNASKAGFLTPLGIAEIIAGAAGIAAVYLNYNKGKAEIEKIPVPGGNTGGASAPSISPPTIQAPEVNLFTATQQGTTAGIIAGTISSNNSADRPMKVYVTSNDVTSTQELDRKALNLARL